VELHIRPNTRRDDHAPLPKFPPLTGSDLT